MAKYDCCGLPYEDARALTEHMRSPVHNLPEFSVALSCCGNDFKEATDLEKHVKSTHRVDLTVQT